MTIDQLQKIIKTHNIPEDVTIKIHTGWGCNETGIKGAYYNETDKLLVLVREIKKYIHWDVQYWKELQEQYPDCDYSKELEYYGKFKPIVI